MKVGLQGFFSCDYFTEDLSCYAPEPSDDVFIDEFRSNVGETNENLAIAPEKLDLKQQDVRRNNASCGKNRSEPCVLMLGGCSANRTQQKKRERMEKKVDSVNADSTEHAFISRESLDQGIKIADQEVRGTVRQLPATPGATGGPPERTLDSSVGNLYDSGRSTETRAPTRANRIVSPRPQNFLQATRKRRTSLVGQQSLLCLKSTQSKAQETRLIKLALAESLRH
jgi:hypothetical protein